ncbi:hypothetical protein Tco_0771213 [Tanacetum coccineum]|uniref:Tf2-1-like SH3-like domain-containing protein n=1 Tax=Tanacetum coccineum TaxID=301880 RepID=A0ABQ4ZFF3_9ASTR
MHDSKTFNNVFYALKEDLIYATEFKIQEMATNVVGGALSRKERVKLRRVRGMILSAQSEAFKQENVLAERLRSLDQQMERKGDESLYFMDRIWVLLVGSVLDEAHTSRYLTDQVSSFSSYTRRFQDVELARIYIDEWNSGDDQLRLRWMIYLVVLADGVKSVRDRSIGFVVLLSILKRMDKVNMCLADANLHVPLDDIKVDKTLCFVEEPIEIMDQEIKKLKRKKIALVKVKWNSKRGPEFTWEHEDQMRIKSPILCAKIGESSLTGLKLVLETIDKVVLIKEKIKAARDCQKSYADKRRKLLEFEVGDQVLLRVSPWKGLVRFGKKGKLVPRYVGPYEILERIGLVAYRLRLPKELNSVHDTFHVSNLKKWLTDANLHVPLDEIKVDKTLRFVKEPVEIMDQEIKKLKRWKIAPMKVR